MYKYMGKIYNLSSELTKSRALALAGCQPKEVRFIFQQWLIGSKKSPKNTVCPILMEWAKVLVRILQHTESLGSPIASLLKSIYPFVRNEERYFQKILALDRQYAFQGAFVLVLPWCLLFFFPLSSWNLFIVAGFLCQILSLLLFYYFVNKSLHPETDERTWLKNFQFQVWMHLSAGQGSWTALSSTIEKYKENSLKFKLIEKTYVKAWVKWFETIKVNGCSKSACALFKGFSKTEQFALLLEQSLLKGAPARESVLEWIEQLDEDIRSEREERMGLLPSKLSLVFCFLLTPAFFLIFMGLLWPQLATSF